MKRSILVSAVRRCVPATVILSFCLVQSRIASAAIADCIDATCRIGTPDGGRGSGCVFELSQGQVYVLTAAHVVENQSAVQCEFWHEGHQSRPLEGRVVARVADDRCDAAIVAVPQSQFGGMLPRAVPIAARDCTLPAGAAVTSVGCANGSWSTGWKGHVVGYQDGELRFVPAPANGRSGSAIFDANGQRIVGLLRARTGDNAQGIATPVQGLYRAFEQKTTTGPSTPPRQSSPVQCPGGVCPAPGGSGSSAPQWRLLPYRFHEQFRNAPQPQPSPSPYPSLPAPVPAPGPTAPSVDLGPVLEQLDRIVREIEGRNSPAPGAAVDEEARKELAKGLSAASSAIETVGKTAAQGIAEAKTEAADAKNAAKTAADVATAAQNQAVAVQSEQRKLEEIVVKHGTLAERWAAHKEDVEARLGENASRLKVDVQTVKDMVHDRAATLREHGVVALVAIAAVLGLLGWAIHHKIEAKLAAGKPLAADAAAAALAGLATANPAVAPVATVLSHLAERVGNLVRRIEATHNTADATLKAVSNQTAAQTSAKAG